MPDFHKIWCDCYDSGCHPECYTIYSSAASK